MWTPPPEEGLDMLARLAALRVNYDAGTLSDADLEPTPLAQFRTWFSDAHDLLPEPNAMVLSTADASGAPSARTVLLKDLKPAGFTFFTNYGSRKGQELAANPRASLVFPWYALHRQVVVIGEVERVSPEETAQYFRSRPRGSQLGAWASRQSTAIPDRLVMEDRYRELEARWPNEVPVPEFWGGFLVRPVSVEFWQGRESRLHDRLRFEALRPGADLGRESDWSVVRLSA